MGQRAPTGAWEGIVQHLEKLNWTSSPPSCSQVPRLTAPQTLPVIPSMGAHSSIHQRGGEPGETVGMGFPVRWNQVSLDLPGTDVFNQAWGRLTSGG